MIYRRLSNIICRRSFSYNIDFIADKNLREDRRLLEFLAFGFVLNDRRSTEAISRLVSAKQGASDIFKAGWLSATPKERFEAMDRTLNQIVKDEIATVEKGKNVIMGLSGGLDSRLILHYLRRNGVEPTTYTFARGYDAEVVRDLAGRLSIKQFTLSSFSWRLDDLYDLARREQDLLFLRRLVAVAEIERAFPDRVEFHGLGGDTTSGAKMKLPVNIGWDEAKKRFRRMNDPFKLASRVGGLKRLPEKSFAPEEDVLFDDQLKFACRNELRIRPHRENSDRIYRYPLFDSRWIGIWLNRSTEERYNRALLIEFIRWLNAPEFFDVTASTGTTGTEMDRFLGNQYAPAKRIEHTGNSLAHEAASRLGKRGVFSKAFLESQIAEIPRSKTARQVLICTELAMGADWFG